LGAAWINPGTLFSRFAQLRELLAIAAEMRELREPLGSPEQFQKLVGVAVRIGLLFGLDAAQLERWRAMLSDEQLFAAEASVVRYFLSRRGVQ
jgi:hypothetical protein